MVATKLSEENTENKSWDSGTAALIFKEGQQAALAAQAPRHL